MKSETTMVKHKVQAEKPNLLLTADNEFILHTNIAKSLFNGNWRHGTMGLLQFATLMSELWKASKADDPYAEQYLLKTYDALEEAKSKLKEQEAILQQQLNNLRGFRVDLYHNTSPFSYQLQFATPFPFLAAMLIEHVDYVNRQLFTLNRFGLIPEKEVSPSELMREIQAVFNVPKSWKHTGVTRKDILEGNQKSKIAQKLLGELSPTVLRKEIKFRFLAKPKGH